MQELFVANIGSEFNCSCGYCTEPGRVEASERIGRTASGGNVFWVALSSAFHACPLLTM